MTTASGNKDRPINGSAGKARHQVIFDDLREAIRRGEYGDGDKLPSERELAQNYGVTRTTTRRALRDLEQVGLVTREGARGTRVLPRKNGAQTEIVTLVCCTEPMAAVDEFLQQAVLQIERKRLGSRILRMSSDEAIPLQRSLSVGNPHLIFAERLDFVPESKLTAMLRQSDTPTLVVGNDLSTQGIPSVICDDVAGLHLALDHLHQNGHTHIALLCGRETASHSVLNTLTEVWAEFIRKQVGPSAADSYLIHVVDRPFESLVMEAYHLTRSFLQGAGGKAATAMICLKEELAAGAFAACRDLDRPVPDSMSLVEYAPTSRSRLASIPRTSIDVHLDRHVAKALALLMKTQSETVRLRTLIKPTLVPGQSVASP